MMPEMLELSVLDTPVMARKGHHAGDKKKTLPPFDADALAQAVVEALTDEVGCSLSCCLFHVDDPSFSLIL
jgi:hypothetical protein